MSQANLSETLFKPRFKHPETSRWCVGFLPENPRRCSRR
ncbi:alpha/beta hydrolase [Klebsiella pneumoniae subsp. pneumoniae]|nr:alpha/beta hydrolase [Klebsiella pneumoniae subsp. pneumoniae]